MNTYRSVPFYWRNNSAVIFDFKPGICKGRGPGFIVFSKSWFIIKDRTRFGACYFYFNSSVW